MNQASSLGSINNVLTYRIDWIPPVSNLPVKLDILVLLHYNFSHTLSLSNLPNRLDLLLLLLQASLGLVAELAELRGQPHRALLLSFTALGTKRYHLVSVGLIDSINDD